MVQIELNNMLHNKDTSIYKKRVGGCLKEAQQRAEDRFNSFPREQFTYLGDNYIPYVHRTHSRRTNGVYDENCLERIHYAGEPESSLAPKKLSVKL